MKSSLLIGAILGFVCGTAFSFIRHEAWPVCLWHGGLAALLAGMLLTWWARAWDQYLTDTMAARQDDSGALVSTSTQPIPNHD